MPSAGEVPNAWSFDVATIPARLDTAGGRNLDHRRWTRVVVASDRLVDAHLSAAQIAGTHGMVVEVLYRE